ncbi:LysM peptidoglycan-binding domain-containing protein [Paenibacillus sp. UNC217MF]|uniref:LysM peptidoglycan-binding domain-containing protein n=1 Tax=Paenibacillus sp. UNC217MF TaxID=1449062 RepID=UPI00048B6233|nr:LysM peptidoglycan-binding domain-containing protein [Paenibacillus sp. UNC217MF]
MNEESYGLRFDIYERVHLSDEVVGIDQLEEVELTPHIQVIPAGDQVTVRGSLLLAGAYVGADELRSSHSLEHWIPVEITLPLNRVRSLDDISVDIEHFDVDLLSTRTLNITGILSLRGISMESIEPAAWEPEQFTVVHQTELEHDGEEPAWLRDYGTYTPAFTKSAEHVTEEVAIESEVATESKVETEADYRDFSPVRASEEQEQEEQTEEQAEEQMEDQAEEELEENFDRAAEDVEVREFEGERLLPAQTNHDAFDGDTPQSERIPLTWSGSQWARETRDEEERLEVQSAEGQGEAGRALGRASAATDSAEHEQAAKMTQLESHSPTLSNDANTNEPVARKESVQSIEVDAAVQSEGEGESLASNQEVERDDIEAAAPLNEPEDVPAAAKQEMKVAIGKSKQSEPEAAEPVGFSSLLQKKRESQELERIQKEEEAAQLAAMNEETTGEEVKWQSLFLQRIDDERAFKKVRLCIVQRSETLDTIADRYCMNSREIALYNRLAESDISEGQVLYIPTS